ncbi:MAG: hypothetical protein V4727_13530 [Verrucomicrobiota bacterium]
MSTQNQETTPDQLLESFRGRSLKSVILFTVIAHIVVISATSVPYLMKSLTGKSASKLSEKDRTELAAREATEALSDIAKKHGLKPQDLSTRIAGGAAPAAPKKEAPSPTAEPATPETAQPQDAVEPEKPKSAIEEQLEVKEEGPKVPTIPVEEASEEDLFNK